MGDSSGHGVVLPPPAMAPHRHYHSRRVESIDEHYINLKILASLPKQTRLDSTGALLRHEQARWWTALKRSWLGDGRAQTVQRVDALVCRCAAIIAAQASTDEAASLRQHLVNAANGIRNLRATYAGDATAQASLDRVLDKLERALANAKQP